MFHGTASDNSEFSLSRPRLFPFDYQEPKNVRVCGEYIGRKRLHLVAPFTTFGVPTKKQGLGIEGIERVESASPLLLFHLRIRFL